MDVTGQTGAGLTSAAGQARRGASDEADGMGAASARCPKPGSVSGSAVPSTKGPGMLMLYVRRTTPVLTWAVAQGIW